MLVVTRFTKIPRLVHKELYCHEDSLLKLLNVRGSQSDPKEADWLHHSPFLQEGYVPADDLSQVDTLQFKRARADWLDDPIGP